MARSKSVALPTEDDVWMELDYRPETGEFFRRKTGTAAGAKTKNGYIEIRVRGFRCYAHRLAWFMSTGDWPKMNIDHINGVRDDNRIANLRDCSQSLNRQNVRAPKGRSGLVGVSSHGSGRRWVARIQPPGKPVVHLGTFETADEARAAYVKAKAIHHDGLAVPAQEAT